MRNNRICSVLCLLAACLLHVTEGLADTAFLTNKFSRLFASSGSDLVTATVSGDNRATYVAGNFSGSISGSSGSVNSSGSQDIFLSKVLVDGSTDWLLKIGGTGTDNAKCLTFDPTSSKVYVGGIFTGTISFGSTNLTASAAQDAFVACYSSAGVLQWARQISGSGQETVTCMKVSSYGLHVCGTYTQSGSWGTTSFTAANNTESMFVLLVDANGQVTSGFYPSSNQSLQPECVAVLPNGTVVIGGRFQGTAFFTPQQPRTSISNGDYDLFVVAYDTSRIFQWVITGGGTGFDEVQSLFVGQQGDLVAGINSGNGGQIASQTLNLTGAGVVVGHISTAGAWSKTFELAGPQLQAMCEGKRGVLHLAANTDTNTVNLGSASVASSGNQLTGFVASYLTNGVWGGVSIITSASASSAAILDITTSADDGVAVGGYSIGGLKLNGQQIETGAGSLDAFVLKLSPPAQVLKISGNAAQMQVKCPAYYYDAALWGTTSLNPISWSQESVSPTINTGEIQFDLGNSQASRFYQLRFNTP